MERANRARLRREMTGMTMPEAGQAERLVMDEAVEKKIDAARLIKADILNVIEQCERESRKTRNSENGHLFGCGEVGHHTLWVEYMPEGEAYRLFNAYSHRMKIETEG